MKKILNISFKGLASAGVVSLAMAVLVLVPSFASAEMLYRTLSVGSRGTDVTSVQTFLAQDVTLYPQGLVTGYFGPLTKSAVMNFQARNGLAADGIIGPISRPVFNAQMSGIGGADANAPIISGVNISASSNSATAYWNTNENARGVIYYSTSPLVLTDHKNVGDYNTVDVSGNAVMTDTSYRSSQSVAISGLQPNTTYYYSIYTTDQVGNVNLTWPTTFRTN